MTREPLITPQLDAGEEADLMRFAISQTGCAQAGFLVEVLQGVLKIAIVDRGTRVETVSVNPTLHQRVNIHPAPRGVFLTIRQIPQIPPAKRILTKTAFPVAGQTGWLSVLIEMEPGMKVSKGTVRI